MSDDMPFKNNHTRLLDELLSYACVSHEDMGLNVYSVLLCCVEFEVTALPVHPVLDEDGNYKYTHFMVYDLQRAERHNDE